MEITDKGYELITESLDDIVNKASRRKSGSSLVRDTGVRASYIENLAQ